MFARSTASCRDFSLATGRALSQVEQLRYPTATDQVPAHIEGGAARLTDARMPDMQRQTKADREAYAAGRRRAAPDTRPARTPATTFPLVSAIPGTASGAVSAARIRTRSGSHTIGPA
jgi:hypothetical protein